MPILRTLRSIVDNIENTTTGTFSQHFLHLLQQKERKHHNKNVLLLFQLQHLERVFTNLYRL